MASGRRALSVNIDALQKKSGATTSKSKPKRDSEELSALVAAAVASALDDRLPPAVQSAVQKGQA